MRKLNSGWRGLWPRQYALPISRQRGARTSQICGFAILPVADCLGHASTKRMAAGTRSDQEARRLDRLLLICAAGAGGLSQRPRHQAEKASHNSTARPYKRLRRCLAKDVAVVMRELAEVPEAMRQHDGLHQGCRPLE